MSKAPLTRYTKPYETVDTQQEVPVRLKKGGKKKNWVVVQYYVTSDEGWEHMKKCFPDYESHYCLRKYKFEKERDVNNFIDGGGIISTKPYSAIVGDKIVDFESSIYAIYNDGKLTFKSKGFEKIQNFRLPPELQTAN
jgi:hypothetical protein